MLEQCGNIRNNVAIFETMWQQCSTLCCAKNCRRESSRVSSPLRQSQLCKNIHCAKHNSLQVHLALPGAVNRF